MTDTDDRKFSEAELRKSPYCPTCKACGEPGCCTPDKCKHLTCYYGMSYAKSYAELLADNERLEIRLAELESAEEARKSVTRIAEMPTQFDLN